MPQTAHTSKATIGHIPDIATGGLCAWRLPADPSCAMVGRSLVRITMTALGLGGDVVDAAMLAASELVTNALHHGSRARPGDPVAPPELWVWARVTPAPRLVVAVFDTCRRSWPETAPRDLLDEHGKGIGIVGAVADAWGVHLSRSRLGSGRRAGQLPGKVVWSAFALPGPWPDAAMTAPPQIVARHLAAAVAERGVGGVSDRHERGVSLVSVSFAGGGAANVWVEPGGLTLTDRGRAPVRRPLADFQDVAEHLVRLAEANPGHHPSRSGDILATDHP